MDCLALVSALPVATVAYCAAMKPRRSAMRTPNAFLTLSRWLPTLIVLVLFSTLASAQRTQGKWEVELHGGWTQAITPTGGTAFLPDPGAPFRTLSFEPSRRESSWYFGDGALLLNELNAALRIEPRIVPLDPALHSPVSRRSDAIFGARVNRQITTRLAAEFSFDYNRSQLEITDEAISDIEGTRTSFISAWNGMLGSDAGLPGSAGLLFVSPVVTSTTTVQRHEGRQVLAVGTLDINLTRSRTVTPFVLAGGGLMSNIGDVPSVTLKGKYQFMFGGFIPVEETDTVQVGYSLPRHVFVGVIGGGFRVLRFAAFGHSSRRARSRQQPHDRCSPERDTGGLDDNPWRLCDLHDAERAVCEQPSSG